MEKITLARAVHDLKTSFRKTFGPVTITSQLEAAINEAARKVKAGFIAEWYEDNGFKIRFTKARRWRAARPPNPPGDVQSNPSVRTQK